MPVPERGIGSQSDIWGCLLKRRGPGCHLERDEGELRAVSRDRIESRRASGTAWPSPLEFGLLASSLDLF